MVRSALVEEWGDGFEYGAGGATPTHFVWGGRRYALGHPLVGRLRGLGGGGRGEQSVGGGVRGSTWSPGPWDWGGGAGGGKIWGPIHHYGMGVGGTPGVPIVPNPMG